MKKKLFITILASLMTITVLSGCRNEADDGPAASEAGQETVKEAEEPEAKESAEPAEETKEEKLAPYAEANGIEFAEELSFSAPAVAYFIGGNGEENVDLSTQGLSISCSDASYDFGEITRSEPDENGLVEVKVPYTVVLANTIKQDASLQYSGDIRSGNKWKTIKAFDYYTGNTLPEIDSDKGEVTENEVSFSYGEDIYSINYSMNSASTSQWASWQNVNGDIYELSGISTCTYTYTFQMPSDYDGLCLYLYLPGLTSYGESEDAGWSSEPEALLSSFREGESREDYVFIRVSDLMAAQAAQQEENAQSVPGQGISGNE